MLSILLVSTLAAAPLPHDTTPRWASVSVGHDHACALDTAGRAFCWGNNHSAQLGARTPEHCGIVGESGHRDCYATASDTPLAVGGGMRFAAISAGRSRTCALDAQGRAFCWGGDLAGAADRCLNGTKCTFAPVAFDPARRFRSLAVESRSMCAVSADGEPLCTNILRGDRWWELGPLQPVAQGKRARAAEAFAAWPTENVCLVDDAGAAWCRGSNRMSQLGPGAPPRVAGEESDSLVRVAGGADFQGLVIEYGWMCGRDADGRALCWGLRSNREVFEPDSAIPGGCSHHPCANAPVEVSGSLRFASIGAHHEQVCGLTAAGEAYCWGPEGVPQRIQPELRFASLAGNVEFGSGSCGVTLSGELYCWGVVNRPPGRVRIAHPR